MIEPKLKAHYIAHRRKQIATWLAWRHEAPRRSGLDGRVYHGFARYALAYARRDVAANVAAPYYDSIWCAPNPAGQPFVSGVATLHWIEEPQLKDLRRAGLSHEIDRRGVKHKGWYVDTDGGLPTLSGIVYQLPTRNCELRFLIGYDAKEDGGAALELKPARFKLPAPHTHIDREFYKESIQDCARQADRSAKLAAESKRDGYEGY